MVNKFVFRSNQTIGAAAAEHDFYLSECFVDTGDLQIIRNTEDTRCLLVGRTGSGKSALLSKLKEVEDHVIEIKPESLALTYISNSNTLKFFAEAGVKLDIFYRLLWRHVCCVELLKERFNIEDEHQKSTFMDILYRWLPNKQKYVKALEYLRRFGESFWEDTEYRIQEVTRNLEKDLQSSIGGTVKVANLSASAARKLTEEQKIEVVNRAQDVVNRVQIRELSDVLDLLGEVYVNDPKQKFYITIDQLDTSWVEDDLRLRLIRALIETSLDFTSKIPTVKVIVALRRDLLDRVFRYTRDAGFQEEKYTSCSLDIRWTREQLTEVLDRRINALIKHQYTKRIVTHADVLPNHINKETCIDFMLDRTLERPRDLIQFFNLCIQKADGKPNISVDALREAEGHYSRDRIRALADEWYSLYPHLFDFTQILKQRSYPFEIRHIPIEDVQEVALQILASTSNAEGIDSDYTKEAWNKDDWEQYRQRMILIFYKVGMVGLKTETYLPISWSYQGGVSISSAEVTDETRVYVHKAFWRALGISDISSKGR